MTSTAIGPWPSKIIAENVLPVTVWIVSINTLFRCVVGELCSV